MANTQLISNIAQIMGNRGVQQGAPVPTDPRQQTMMQQLGITNPLLQQFGQQVGNLVGADTRSAAQQLTGSLGKIDATAPDALEQQLVTLANSPAASPEQRLTAVNKLKELRAAEASKRQQMTRQDAFAKFISTRHPELSDLAAKGVVTVDNYKDFVAGGKDAELGYLVDKTTGRTIGNVAINGDKVYRDGKLLTQAEMEKQGVIVSSAFQTPASSSTNKIGSVVNLINEATGERIDVKYDDRGNPYDLTGNPIPDSSLVGFTEIIKASDRAQGAQAEAAVKFNSSLIEGVEDSDYDYGSSIQTGAGLIATANSAPPIGAGGEVIQALASGVSSLARLTGSEVPQNISNILQTGAELTTKQIDMLKPFVEQQGRGFTDADRKNVVRALPSVTSTPELLRLIGTMAIASGYDNKEKIELGSYFAGLEERSKVSPKAAWADYKFRLPRTFQATGADGKLLPVMAIQDDSKLYKYWQGGSPKSFDIKKADGSTVSLSWDAINAEAKDKGVSPRTYMSVLESRGLILNANY